MSLKNLARVGESSKGEKMLDQKGTVLERVRGQDIGPSNDALGGGNNPKVFERMVDDEDIFVLSGGDVPSSAEELDCIGRAHTAG